MRSIFDKYACFLMVAALAAAGPAQEGSPDAVIRLVNGMPVEGSFISADPQGMTVQSSKGNVVLPWKYLSAGTRWRYERPMLAELEAKRIRAEKAAKAKAEAEAKAAAAKAAKAAGAGTNALPAATDTKAAAQTPAATAESVTNQAAK